MTIVIITTERRDGHSASPRGGSEKGDPERKCKCARALTAPGARAEREAVAARSRHCPPFRRAFHIEYPMKSQPPTPTRAPDNQFKKCKIN